MEESVKYAFILGGESLALITGGERRKRLVEISDRCEVVVACRVSPK